MTTTNQDVRTAETMTPAREPLDVDEHDGGDEGELPFEPGDRVRCIGLRAVGINARPFGIVISDLGEHLPDRWLVRLPDGSDCTFKTEDLARVEVKLVRRAEARLTSQCTDVVLGPLSIALEDFDDGSSELVLLDLDDQDAEAELVRVDASAFFAAIDRLRAFAHDPTPPKPVTDALVEAAEGLLPMLGSLLPQPAPMPLRPVPGGKK